MINRKRQHLFQGRLSSEESSMLDQLCDREGLTRIQMVRTWIRTEWKRLFGEKEEK